MSKLLCFKQTRHMHESGYRYIEYGYIDDEDNVEVVGRYDVISSVCSDKMPFNLDLTKSGWFRIMPHIDAEFEWLYGGTIAIKSAKPTNQDNTEKEE